MYDDSDLSLDQAHAVRIIGAPFDGTVSFRPGARFGPAAIREASDGVETYSPLLDLDVQQVRYADAGDLALPMGDVQQALRLIREACDDCVNDGAMPFVLGGEHLVSLPVIEALHQKFPSMVIVQLDAHADQREDYLGVKLSHACIIRRASEVIGENRVKQIGIRSGTREEYQTMRGQESLTTFKPDDLSALRTWVGDRPLYITVDLDVFDPASFPGTGTPEPGGIDWWTFQRFIQSMQGLNIVGMDAVELAPQWDSSGCSSVLAAKCVREMLLLKADA
ncbi:MAG: agmatinase [Zetaproteobacteria bacterium]|nr:agmatinase [Zetaproteobacteria bacterium]